MFPMDAAAPPTAAIGGARASRVYEALKDRLISGEWEHGARLSVESLGAEFGVSKQPIMDALRLLSADGIVEIIPRVGCEVSTFSRQEVIDFFEMFSGFEAAIAAAAAQRRTPEQCERMAEAVPSFERLGEILDDSYRSRRYIQLNHEFHTMIHVMADSRMMSTTSRRMWDLADFLINTTGMSLPMAHATESRHAEHEVIRAAIVAGDAAAARAAMAHHILRTVDLISPE